MYFGRGIDLQRAQLLCLLWREGEDGRGGTRGDRIDDVE